MATQTKEPKKWVGTLPTNCDVCGKPFTDTFIDGRTTFGGRWGNLCPTCHSGWGVGLGEGFGQKYDAKTGVKLEG